jgi:hypothetical protein
MALARAATHASDLDQWTNAMQAQPRQPRDDMEVERPINEARRDRRTHVEAPADSDGRAASEAHAPRPHPPVEEPEEHPEEHAPETEPDTDPDANSDSPQRPPRPGKAPR